jgi:hypothetical protein
MMLSARPNKHAVNIVERPIPKARSDVPTVSFSAYAHLFSELISYAMERAASITELEERCAARGAAWERGGPGGLLERRPCCERGSCPRPHPTALDRPIPARPTRLPGWTA